MEDITIRKKFTETNRGCIVLELLNVTSVLMQTFLASASHPYGHLGRRPWHPSGTDILNKCVYSWDVVLVASGEEISIRKVLHKAFLNDGSFHSHMK